MIFEILTIALVTELDRIGYDCHTGGKQQANQQNDAGQVIVGKQTITDDARYGADSIADY
jgi:hypothetical protein